jgi:hypothetical protein
MVDKILTYSEVNWWYLAINWELRDFFPEPGTKIRIRVKKEIIDATINKRKRIRTARLFEVLKPKVGDELSIIRKDFAMYEVSMKNKLKGR